MLGLAIMAVPSPGGLGCVYCSRDARQGSFFPGLTGEGEKAQPGVSRGISYLQLYVGYAGVKQSNLPVLVLAFVF